MRFLPAFDELLMGHADRSRVMTDEVRAQVCVPDLIKASVLVDGMAATWTTERVEAHCTLVVRPLASISAAERMEIRDQAEGAADD